MSLCFSMGAPSSERSGEEDRSDEPQFEMRPAWVVSRWSLSHSVEAGASTLGPVEGCVRIHIYAYMIDKPYWDYKMIWYDIVYDQRIL